MSHNGEARMFSHGWPRRSVLADLPSWLASLALHALLLLVFASGLKSCGTGRLPGRTDGDYREVGIVLKLLKETLVEKPDAEEQLNQQPTDATFSAPLAAPELDVPDQPPVELHVPRETTPIIGAGGGPVAALDAASDVGTLVRPNGLRIAAAAALRGDVRFFGVRDKGTRFLYVLDSSGSMANYNAIRVAKAELMASLESLDKTQQFQIIFYNQTPHLMTLRGDKKAQLYWATDINRTLARQFIAGIRADLGTNHMPALKKALRMNPDVLFLLTDADEPQITAADLNDIDKLNKGRTRIHCIEFGKGAELSTDNYLKKLARQNGGTHRYRDVTRFSRK